MINRILQISIATLLLSIGCCITCFASDEYNFRLTSWGMSQEEVKKSENGEPNQDTSGKSLVYQSELLGEKVLIVYNFEFNKLTRAKYMLLKYFAKSQQIRFGKSPITKNPFPGECIADYGKFENALIEKYGKPVSQETRYSKEIDINDKTDLEVMEDAIRRAKGYWSSSWKTNDSDVLLLLHGGGGDLAFEISYSSIKLDHLEKEAPL